VKRLLCLLAALALALPLAAAPAVAAPAAPEKWDTHVFATVPEPGFPAYVHVHTNGRVYAGTYIDPQGAGVPSRVFEWSGSGQLLRSWAVPQQLLSGDHGVQVANQTRGGKLVLLETSTSSVLTLDVTTGRFHRVARIPDLPTCLAGGSPCSPNLVDAPAVPNYATWGPHGALFVTDYAQAVIWRIARGGRPTPWFTSRALDGTEFGTTGIRYRPRRHDLLVSQQASLGLDSLPTNGHLYRLPVRADGRPGALSTLWTSQPGELPDGFGIGRSGHVYVAMAGLSAQLVELSASGRELDRFPDTPLTGENGSSIPFDTPCSASFLGTRVLVANQSAVAGDPSHQAILDVQVGERGRASYLPRGAHF
jgi:hypothetical protein